LSFNEAHDEFLEDLLLASFEMLKVFLYPHSLIEIPANEFLHHQLFDDLA